MKVFLSSTYIDLIEHRKAAHTRLEQRAMQVIKMELSVHVQKNFATACLKEVEESDLFVGIYAHRYGYIPAWLRISITETGIYSRTENLESQFIGFIVDEEHQWHPKIMEG